MTYRLNTKSLNIFVLLPNDKSWLDVEDRDVKVSAGASI